MKSYSLSGRYSLVYHENGRSSLKNCIHVTNGCEQIREIIESIDWGAFINVEYKPGTDEKYLAINVVKRRRIDSSEAEFAKYTYIAHPFAKENRFRLLDDMNQEKILSLKSLVSDIDVNGKEKTNATARLKNMEPSEFIDIDDE